MSAPCHLNGIGERRHSDARTVEFGFWRALMEFDPERCAFEVNNFVRHRNH